MPINKSTEYGSITISLDAIASLAGGAITECYGVIGMASQQTIRDGWAELLNKENYRRGVVVRQQENGLVLDLYIIAMQGIKLSQIVYEAQKRVKYQIEKTLEAKVASVNIIVQGVKTLK